MGITKEALVTQRLSTQSDTLSQIALAGEAVSSPPTLPMAAVLINPDAYVGYYLSGLPPTYLQQAYSDWTLPSVRVDDNVVRRSGLVPLSDLERWLSREAGYAVINPTYLAAHDQEFLGATRVMRELLDRHFDRIATVADYPPAVYDVYRRKR